MYQGTAILEPPTASGSGGQAWRIRLPPVGQRARPDHDATVDAWIVRVPGAHVCWDHWALTVVHLRSIAGVRAAHRHVPEATHEFLILALNPEKPLPPLDAAHAGFQIHWLTPIDVCMQFMARSDAVAAEILELAVTSIVDGHASPDQDWRPWWTRAIAETAQHFADGAHSRGRPS